MNKLIPTIDHVLSHADISVASGFSSYVNDQVFTSVQELVISYINDFAKSKGLLFTPNIGWLDEGWEIIDLDDKRFRFGVFLDDLDSRLQVVIEDYLITKRSKAQKAKGKVGRPGQIRGVDVIITSTLTLDHEFLCTVIVDKVNEVYQSALIDYRSALRDYCLASASDDLYDVLRKSRIPEVVQKEITLYCVFEALGRHIPSLDRINELIARLHSNTQSMNVCPMRLAIDFFLTPLDGRRYDLYTQKAFREGQTIVVPGTKYSGESYVRLATEAFFGCVDGNIQPIASVGDAWLLSAIYPSRLASLIQPEIEKEKYNFKLAIDNIQAKHRDSMNRLKHLVGQRPAGESRHISVAGEFLGGIIKAFIT